MVFSVTYTIRKGPELDAYMFQSVTPDDFNLILFVSISIFLKSE